MKKFIAEIFFSFRKKGGAVALTSMSMQVGSIVLTFVTNLFLARIMLPSDYGAFAYASSLIFVMAGLGTFGAPNLIVKETAAKDVSYIKRLLHWTTKRSAVFVLLLLVVFVFISLQFELFFGTKQMEPFRIPMQISLLAAPLLSFLYIYQAFLQGRGKIFSALFSEKILKSVFFLLLGAIFFFIAGKEPLRFNSVAIIHFFHALFTCRYALPGIF